NKFHSSVIPHEVAGIK
ncbi:hypothetical protein ACJX0J_042038, partial [Zea mays]